MSACMTVLYSMAFLTLAVRLASQAPLDDPTAADRLYANRAVLADARAAADIWAARVARDPRDFESAWKLARACYWIGGRARGEAVKRAFERGMAAARQAASVHPDRPEGHFWLAANMGGLAETQGLRAGLRYRSAIRESLERVLAIDAAFQKGSADRALGRWYFKVPGLFGGSKQKSEFHLRRSLTYDADSHASRFFLAETLLAMHRLDEAIAELERIIATPDDPDWIPEDQDFKRRARNTLKGLAWKRAKRR